MHLKCLHLKLLQKAIQKISEKTGDLIGNKITDIIIKVSGTSPQNSSGTIRNKKENMEHDRENPKGRYISPEKWQKIIDDLILTY